MKREEWKDRDRGFIISISISTSPSKIMELGWDLGRDGLTTNLLGYGDDNVVHIHASSQFSFRKTSQPHTIWLSSNCRRYRGENLITMFIISVGTWTG